MASRNDVRPGGPIRHRWLPFALLAAMAAAAAAETGEPLITRRATGAPAMAAARIMSGQEGGTLPLSVAALFDRLPADERVVPLLVHVDGGALLAAAGERAELPLGIFVYLLTPEGRVAATLSEVVRIDVAGRRPCLERGGLDFVGSVPLPAGLYSLRVFVRGARAADSGLRVLEIEVPAAADDRPAMLPPLFRGAAAGCVALQQSIAEGEVRLPLFDLADPPAAGFSLAAGGRVEFELLASGRGEDQPLVLELFDPSQRVAATLPVEVLERRPSEEGWQERLTAAVETGDMEPGVYRVRARWGEASREATVSARLEVTLVGAARPGGEPSEPSLAVGDRKAAAAAGSAEYLRALRTLAEGEWLAAQTAVETLERAALDHPEEQAVADLAAAQDAVMQAVAAAESPALIPVYVLHRNLHNRYRGEKQFLLAQHARARAQRAIDLFLEHTTWLQGREIGADLLANFAGDLQRAGILKTSEALFQRAVTAIPRHRAALYGLGAALEKSGSYDAAAALFETLVEISPDDAHAQLRLAINLRRTERRREAIRLLTGLVDGRPPGWIHSLACQELAALRLQRGDADEAEELLRACLESRPRDEKLLLQLAFVLSSGGRLGEARELLAERSFRAGTGRADSPRYRYSRWPSEDLAKTRDRVRARAQAELRSLAAALGAAAREVAP